MGKNSVLFSIFLLFCAAPVSLFGLQQAGDRPPADPQPRPPERTQPDRQPGQSTRIPERPFRYFLLTGKIVLEDGSPLRESVLVELRCGGRVERQTHSGPGGGFSFHFDDQSQVEWSDASVGTPGFGRSGGVADGRFGRLGGGMPGQDTTLDLSACDVSASVPGFRSNTLAPGIRRALDNPDLGTIVLSRLENVGGTTISLNTLAAPRRARSRYDRALRELGRSKPNLDRVDRDLSEAVKEYPEFAAAWKLLADVRLELRDEAGARRAYGEAIEADSNYITPYLALAQVESRAGQWDEVSRLSARVIELDANLPEAHFFNAISAYNLGKPELAESSARKIRSGPEVARFPNVYHLLGLISWERGDYVSAAEELRLFLEAVPDTPSASQIRDALLDWERMGLIPSEPVDP